MKFLNISKSTAGLRALLVLTSVLVAGEVMSAADAVSQQVPQPRIWTAQTDDGRTVQYRIFTPGIPIIIKAREARSINVLCEGISWAPSSLTIAGENQESVQVTLMKETQCKIPNHGCATFRLENKSAQTAIVELETLTCQVIASRS